MFRAVERGEVVPVGSIWDRRHPKPIERQIASILASELRAVPPRPRPGRQPAAGVPAAAPRGVGGRATRAPRARLDLGFSVVAAPAARLPSACPRRPGAFSPRPSQIAGLDRLERRRSAAALNSASRGNDAPEARDRFRDGARGWLTAPHLATPAVHDGEIGQHLAVDVDLRALQAGRKGAVGHSGSRTAALMRVIHKARNAFAGDRGRRIAQPSSPPVWRWKTFFLRPRNPFACLRTFLCAPLILHVLPWHGASPPSTAACCIVAVLVWHGAAPAHLALPLGVSCEDGRYAPPRLMLLPRTRKRFAAPRLLFFGMPSFIFV